MDCSQARDWRGAYVDAALAVADCEAVERHLTGCADCRAAFAAEQQMSAAIRRHATRYAAPADLAARIAALPRPQAQVLPMPQRRRNTQRMALAASILAAALLGGGAAHYADLLGGRDRGVEEIVAAHLRSLMEGHLTDVASADGHTVKPWFNGRTDIAPPTSDFTLQGFPLVGGRLDYLDGRAVPALVYRRHGHAINLFVAPADAATRLAPESVTRQGYHVLRWINDGLAFTAVSDLNVEELREFERLVRSAS
jgi:anti-sigma factor RsiW